MPGSTQMAATPAIRQAPRQRVRGLFVERHFVEQRPIAGHVALDFRVAARAEFGLCAIVEVATRDRSKGDGRARPMLRLVRLRIPPKVDPRERSLAA